MHVFGYHISGEIMLCVLQSDSRFWELRADWLARMSYFGSHYQRLEMFCLISHIKKLH